ncbi:MAG: hypothetical protein HQ567_06275 [Candidatus Nealsonbacteria bacterium]|nr:hypothetical protein [Candidatus Nealsonbacteria bacterium]
MKNATCACIFGPRVAAFVISAVLLPHVCPLALAAEPVIEAWSSQGGRTLNKDDDRDRMYLVQPGDSLTFEVKARAATDFEWQVNKSVNKAATGDSFAWTVPDEKGIWEIHLKATGDNGEAHQEWVVSTLSKAEAPDFFDYFTDGKWCNRTETDPWGRELPEWKKNTERGWEALPDASDRVMKMNGNLFNSALLCASHDATHGTWKCKIRVTPAMGPHIERSDGRVTIGFYPLTCDVRDAVAAGIRMAAEFQGHNWAYVTATGPNAYHACACSMPLVGAWGTSDGVTFDDDHWKDVKAIRTPDGYIRYWKGTGMHGHNGYFNDDLMDTRPLQPGDPDPLGDSRNVGIIIRNDSGTNHWGEIDCIEIYKDRFMSPKKIRHGKYVNSYGHDNATHSDVPQYRTGILVDGFGVRLADIVRAVDNKAIFRYDPSTSSADCHTDLCIRAGAELILKGETLRMHCRSDGEHQIRVKNGALVKLENSTVTAPDRYCQWVLPSEFTPSSEYCSRYQSAFTGRFIARNSTIDHCGGLYFSGPTELVLENTELTNLVHSTYPTTPHSGYVYRRWSEESGREHSLSFRGRQVCSRLAIKGCRISAKARTTMRFLSMDTVVENTTIYDTVLQNVDVLVGEAHVAHVGGLLHPTTLSLVNVEYEQLLFATDNASILPKYYLDVKVVDGAGRPVPGAKVNLINEVDPGYGPQYLYEGMIYVKERGYAQRGKEPKVPADELVGRRKPVYGRSIHATTTGEDGHTPLPTDANNIMIVTDFVQDKSGKRQFTYAISVEKDGRKKTITGVDPGPDWFRPDPNKPTYTITAVLDGKTKGK